jgi:hypothetical protein
MESQPRKRLRELLEHQPQDVAAAVAVLCRTKRDVLHPDHDVFGGSKRDVTRSFMGAQQSSTQANFVKGVPVTDPGEVLSEEELRAYDNFVCSSGRCRRDCPELYSHLVKRMSILRHEDEMDVLHSDLK